MNRRQFGAMAAGALLAGPVTARAAGETITVHVSGGFYGDGNIKAFVEPFEKESGIHVNAVKSEVPPAQFELAAKTGSRILPVGIRRHEGGRFGVTWPDPITVSSSDPAELQRATQALADALGETIRLAPEQWYNFKPIWPAGEAEAADLERRARLMQAGVPDPGPNRGLPRDEADSASAAPAAASEEVAG